MHLRTHRDTAAAHLVAFGATLGTLALAAAAVALLDPGAARTWTIAALAAFQAAVSLRLAFHIDLKHTPRENLLALAFTAVLMGVVIGGTSVIMGDLRERMMPDAVTTPRPKI